VTSTCVGHLRGPISRSGWRWLAIGFVLLLPLALWSGAEQARAATLPSNCTASGATVTCTFSAGSEGTFTVPTAVSTVHVVAVGAGGGGTLGGTGGPGAQVSADLSVTPGSTLFAEVNIGGGAGGADGAGGGGESDLRTCSITNPSCPGVGNPFQDPRLIVAGGGGGAGAAGGGGSGGAGGVGSNTCNPGVSGTNGDAGTVGGGGAGGGCPGGGTGGFAGPGGVAGTNGTASSGGAGGTTFHGGGGGGAGYFGGGGGGSNGASNGGGAGNGGGGGGGSSFGPGGSVFATATTGPQVQISYQAVVPGAPAGVTATPGNTQISVSWSAPASDGGLPVTGYTVSAQAGGTTVTQTLDNPSTSAVIGGLTNGTAYNVTVAAVNGVGAGPAAAAAGNPVTPTASAPLITSSNSLAVGVGQKLSFKVTAVGKPKPTITASGLPTWLTFTPAAGGGSGTVSGSPPAGAGGVYPITFSASNGVGFTATQNATVSVLEFTSPASVTFPLNQSDSFTVTTSLASSSVAIALSGALPPNVSFTVAGNGTATLSGVPAGKAKSYSITFKATFGTATSTQKFTLTTTG
jgi:Fibronectin type III domain